MCCKILHFSVYLTVGGCETCLCIILLWTFSMSRAFLCTAGRNWSDQCVLIIVAFVAQSASVGLLGYFEYSWKCQFLSCRSLLDSHSSSSDDFSGEQQGLKKDFAFVGKGIVYRMWCRLEVSDSEWVSFSLLMLSPTSVLWLPKPFHISVYSYISVDQSFSSASVSQ